MSTEVPFTKRSTTHRSSALAFREHCDYACAVHRGPRNSVWRRLMRFFFGPADKWHAW